MRVLSESEKIAMREREAAWEARRLASEARRASRTNEQNRVHARERDTADEMGLTVEEYRASIRRAG